MLPSLLLSSALNLPSSSSSPRGRTRLLSARDPLSIPTTTVNFRRFVSKSGPIFWLQDRVEEVVMWRKGWKVTTVWIAAYAFLCYFPRMVLLLPHAILLGIMLATHPSIHSPSEDTASAAPPANAGEGTVDWQANIQAIQNLMGAVADANDAILPFIPYLTHASPYTPLLFTATFLSFLLLLPILALLPLRPTFLFLGLFPFVLTHPFTLSRLPHLLPRLRAASSRVLRTAADNDRLLDKHCQSEMRKVELWENERCVEGVWGKAQLRAGERTAWTRGRDGCGGVKADGSGDVSSTLTFSLSPGWSFVETEDWRADVEAAWNAPLCGDEDGWVYTNDAWLEPRAEWKTGAETGAGAVTRRRRWVRRIYFDPVLLDASASAAS